MHRKAASGGARHPKEARRTNAQRVRRIPSLPYLRYHRHLTKHIHDFHPLKGRIHRFPKEESILNPVSVSVSSKRSCSSSEFILQIHPSQVSCLVATGPEGPPNMAAEVSSTRLYLGNLPRDGTHHLIPFFPDFSRILETRGRSDVGQCNMSQLGTATLA